MLRNTQAFEIRPLSNAVGAELFGLDLAAPVDDACLQDLRDALATHGMIVIRDQDLTPEQHLGLAKRWGTVNVNRFFQSVDGHPEIAEVRKEPNQDQNIGGSWHTDHSYDTEPAMGSMIYARELPERGGDTLFASTAHAFDALSRGMQTMLEGLRAVHSSRHVFGNAAAERLGNYGGRLHNRDLATQDASHPVVITHPDSGRKCLYVNPGFTLRFDGWTEDESKPLLSYLYAHIARPEFTCRVNWQKGSLGFWDNRATWHYALNDYPGERRLMHRITLQGVALG